MAQVNLVQKFPSLRPIKSPPSMFRLNGCGVGLYGQRDRDPDTNSYVATLCVSILFVPVLCLRAYRVVRALGNSWYFLGREPLSSMAKVWNGLLVAAIALGIAGWQHHEYTSSPAYQARQEMDRAGKCVEKGQLAQAAKIYQAQAASTAGQADNATKALQGLLDQQCGQAPLAECAGVYAAIVQVARRGHVISLSHVADKGLQLAADRGDSDPRAAVAILEAVRPLVTDTRPIDARRLPLLRKQLAAEPGNIEVAVPLASLLEQADQLDEAKKLLLPMKSQLGTGEGARVLGTILGRQGDYASACELLGAFVQNRLPNLHAAERAVDDTGKRLWDREVQVLNSDQCPKDFAAKYRAAGRDAQDAMVQEYITGRIKNDPQFLAAQEARERSMAVVPVALDLGILMLQRAQGLTDPEARKAQLQAAEKAFLDIGGVAGQTDEYRLSLGQVYYWLGKQADGRKLFDEFLSTKNRSSAALLEVAARLRNLGDEAEARDMAEESHKRATKPEEQYAAANVRSLLHKDNDDRIAWLNKSNTSEPWVKARLASALGAKAFEQGQDAEAVRQYRASIAAYEGLPRSQTTLNETALASYAIFFATGDRQTLEQCFDRFQQAVDLNPGDPILLYNAGVSLLEAALVEVVGAEIDLRALRQTPSTSMLSYLYKDQAGRDAIARRVKEHPGITRALSYLDKARVLSPKRPESYSTAYQVYAFTHDQAAVTAMEARARAASPDTADQLTRVLDHLKGVKDEQDKVAGAAGLKRYEELASSLRAKGGRTAAVAMTGQAAAMMGLDSLGVTADAAKVVAWLRRRIALPHRPGPALSLLPPTCSAPPETCRPPTRPLPHS